MTGERRYGGRTLSIPAKNLCVPFRATGFELDGSQVCNALATLWRVREYARIFLAPTQSLTKVRTSIGAVARRPSQVNNHQSRSDGDPPARATRQLFVWVTARSSLCKSTERTDTTRVKSLLHLIQTSFESMPDTLPTGSPCASEDDWTSGQ